MAVMWNMNQLRILQEWYADRADQTRAAVSLLLRYGDSPAIPADRGMQVAAVTGELFPVDEPLTRIPGRARLAAIVEAMGSPVEDALVPGSSLIPDAVLDAIFVRLVRDEFEIGATLDEPFTKPLVALGSQGLLIDQDGDCIVVAPEAPGAWVSLSLDSASTLHVSTDTWGVGELFVSLTGTTRESGLAHEASPEQATLIDVPDIGAGETMLIRYLPPEDGNSWICLEA